jgi:hypothetical protein
MASRQSPRLIITIYPPPSRTSNFVIAASVLQGPLSDSKSYTQHNTTQSPCQPTALTTTRCPLRHPSAQDQAVVALLSLPQLSLRLASPHMLLSLLDETLPDQQLRQAAPPRRPFCSQRSPPRLLHHEASFLRQWLLPKPGCTRATPRNDLWCGGARATVTSLSTDSRVSTTHATVSLIIANFNSDGYISFPDYEKFCQSQYEQHHTAVRT